MTLDSTSFITANSSESKRQYIYLTTVELLQTRPNTRVVTVDSRDPNNSRGATHQVFCQDDTLNPKKGTPVCLYKNQWHSIIHDRKNQKFIVGTISQANFYNTKAEGKTAEEPQATTSQGTIERTPTPEQATSPEASTESIQEPPTTSLLRLTTIPDDVRTSPIQSPLMSTTTQTVTATAARTLIGANLSRAGTPNIH